MKFWNVFLGDNKVVPIDTVMFTEDCDANYVKQSLIEHDGYNPEIEVRAQELLNVIKAGNAGSPHWGRITVYTMGKGK